MTLDPAASPLPAKKGKPSSFWVAWMLALLLLASLAANGFLATLAALSGGGLAATEGADRFREVLVDGEKGEREKVVVLPIHGVIREDEDGVGGRHLVTDVRAALRALREDDDVKALVLDIDSPGGGVTASDEIYHEVKRFRDERKVPVVALFGDTAASGGYYVAMAADHIVARATTITGSIGVISQFVVVKDLMGRLGVEVNTIKSLNDQGKESFKDMGSPFREMTPRERQLLQALITEMWERFTGIVAEGRKGKLTLAQVRALADGRIFSGEEARKLKLVDSLGYPEDAWARARELAKAPKARVVRLRRRETLFDVLNEVGAREGAGSGVVRSLERAAGTGPRFMYLWSAP